MKLIIIQVVLFLSCVLTTNQVSAISKGKVLSIISLFVDPILSYTKNIPFKRHGYSFLKEKKSLIDINKDSKIATNLNLVKDVYPSVLDNSADDYKYNNKMIKLNNQHPFYSGPNCWNLALYMNGINHNLRFTDRDEFTSWLESPLCHKVSNPKYGDIITMRYGTREVHAMIYLDESKVFSKNGLNSEFPYKFDTLEEVIRVYCMRSPVNIDIHYFRCSDIHQFLSSSTSNFVTDFYKWNHEISKMSKRLYKAYFENQLLEEVEISEMLSHVDQLKHEIDEMRLNSIKEENDLLICNAFFNTLNSIYKNLKYVILRS